jgi:hypothetical protein
MQLQGNEPLVAAILAYDNAINLLHQMVALGDYMHLAPLRIGRDLPGSLSGIAQRLHFAVDHFACAHFVLRIFHAGDGHFLATFGQDAAGAFALSGVISPGQAVKVLCVARGTLIVEELRDDNN